MCRYVHTFIEICTHAVYTPSPSSIAQNYIKRDLCVLRKYWTAKSTYHTQICCTPKMYIFKHTKSMYAQTLCMCIYVLYTFNKHSQTIHKIIFSPENLFIMNIGNHSTVNLLVLRSFYPLIWYTYNLWIHISFKRIFGFDENQRKSELEGL